MTDRDIIDAAVADVRATTTGTDPTGGVRTTSQVGHLLGRVPLTPFGIGVCVLGLTAYIAGWRLGWIELLVLAAGCLVGLVIAVPFVIGRSKIDIERRHDPARVSAGDTVEVTLTATNRGRSASRRVVVDEIIGEHHEPIPIPGLAPAASVERRYTLPTRRRARIVLGPAVISRSDPLGLMRRDVSESDTSVCWVYPRTRHVSPLPVGFAKDLEGPTSDSSPAGDISFHTIRPYRSGDDRRHIHWLTTAKTGSLMVRHFVDNRRPHLAVLLDRGRAAYPGGGAFETAVSIAASLCTSMLAAKLPVSARLGSETVIGNQVPADDVSVLQDLTLVDRNDDGPTDLARPRRPVPPIRTARVGARGRDRRIRPASDLLATVVHARRSVRIILVHVSDGPATPIGPTDDSGSADHRGSVGQRGAVVPGASSLHVERSRGVRSCVGGVALMQRTVRRPFAKLAAAQLAVVMAASVASVASFKAVFVDWDFMVGRGHRWGRRCVRSSRSPGGRSCSSARRSPSPLWHWSCSARSRRAGSRTRQAFVTFANGLVSGWAELLSLSPQFDDTAELRVLPFVLAWIATLLGGELLHRTTQPTLPALGPLVGLTVSALVTAENRTIATIQGIIIAVGALAVGRAEFLTRRSSDDDAPATVDPQPERSGVPAPTAPDRRVSGTHRHWVGRLARAAAACLVVGIAAPFVGPRLPFADANERFDLRDRRVPPWDPLLLASPLVEVKSTLKDDARDDVMFTVTTDQPITRWNVAVLGDYDGTVWTVGSAEGRDAANEFRPVGRDLVDPPNTSRTDTRPVSATVTIGDLTGAFLPTAGWADTVEFTSAPAPTDPELGTDGVRLAQDRLRMNLVTGTIAVPTGVAGGLQYDIAADIAPEPTDDELALLGAAPFDGTDELDAVPPPVRNLTADLVEGLDPGWQRIAAIRDRFVNDGFYDVSELARPGHSYFRLAEFLAEPDRLVGFEEQYSAAAATMARVAEVRSRIVVGYLVAEDRYVDGTVEVVAADLSAWIEVDLGATGWVPVDVSPDRSREPTAEATGVTVQDVAVPSPPPPPPIPPTPEVFADDEPEEVDEDEDEDEEEDDDVVSDGAGIGVVATVGLAVGSVIALAVLVAVAVAVSKSVRRRRRRNEADASVSVASAWQEAVDRYVETGTVRAARATPARGHEAAERRIGSRPRTPGDDRRASRLPRASPGTARRRRGLVHLRRDRPVGTRRPVASRAHPNGDRRAHPPSPPMRPGAKMVEMDRIAATGDARSAATPGRGDPEPRAHTAQLVLGTTYGRCGVEPTSSNAPIDRVARSDAPGETLW